MVIIINYFVALIAKGLIMLFLWEEFVLFGGGGVLIEEDALNQGVRYLNSEYTSPVNFDATLDLRYYFLWSGDLISSNTIVSFVIPLAQCS